MATVTETYPTTGGATIGFDGTGDTFAKNESVINDEGKWALSYLRTGEGTAKGNYQQTIFVKIVPGSTADATLLDAIPPNSQIIDATLTGIANTTTSETVDLRIGLLDRGDGAGSTYLKNEAGVPRWMDDVRDDWQTILAGVLANRLVVTDTSGPTDHFDITHSGTWVDLGRVDDGGDLTGTNEAGYVVILGGSDIDVDEVELSLRRYSSGSGTSASGNVQIELWTIPSFANADSFSSTATLLGTSATKTIASLGTGASNTETFTFSSAVTVPAGSNLCVIVGGDWTRNGIDRKDIPQLGVSSGAAIGEGAIQIGRAEGFARPIYCFRDDGLPHISGNLSDTLTDNLYDSTLTFNGIGNWTAGDSQDFDVTTLVQEWVDDADYVEGDPMAFVLDPLLSTTSANDIEFASDSNATYAGFELTVEWEPPLHMPAVAMSLTAVDPTLAAVERLLANPGVMTLIPPDPTLRAVQLLSMGIASMSLTATGPTLAQVERLLANPAILSLTATGFDLSLIGDAVVKGAIEGIVGLAAIVEAQDAEVKAVLKADPRIQAVLGAVPNLEEILKANPDLGVRLMAQVLSGKTRK